jgi:hypothetical protein
LLRFSNGNTAIDFSGNGVSAAADGAVSLAEAEVVF